MQLPLFLELNAILINFRVAFRKKIEKNWLFPNEIYKKWSGMKASEYKKYKGTRELYEKETKKSAISSKNNLKYKYIEEVKQIKDEKN